MEEDSRERLGKPGGRMDGLIGQYLSPKRGGHRLQGGDDPGSTRPRCGV